MIIRCDTKKTKLDFMFVGETMDFYMQWLSLAGLGKDDYQSEKGKLYNWYRIVPSVKWVACI